MLFCTNVSPNAPACGSGRSSPGTPWPGSRSGSSRKRHRVHQRTQNPTHVQAPPHLAHRHRLVGAGVAARPYWGDVEPGSGGCHAAVKVSALVARNGRRGRQRPLTWSCCATVAGQSLEICSRLPLADARQHANDAITRFPV